MFFIIIPHELYPSGFSSVLPAYRYDLNFFTYPFEYCHGSYVLWLVNKTRLHVTSLVIFDRTFFSSYTIIIYLCQRKLHVLESDYLIISKLLSLCNRDENTFFSIKNYLRASCHNYTQVYTRWFFPRHAHYFGQNLFNFFFFLEISFLGHFKRLLQKPRKYFCNFHPGVFILSYYALLSYLLLLLGLTTNAYENTFDFYKGENSDGSASLRTSELKCDADRNGSEGIRRKQK